jgi:hypothetical protein
MDSFLASCANSYCVTELITIYEKLELFQSHCNFNLYRHTNYASTENVSTLLCYNILLATCFHADFLLGLFFDPEDGGDIFLRNVS